MKLYLYHFLILNQYIKNCLHFIIKFILQIIYHFLKLHLQIKMLLYFISLQLIQFLGHFIKFNSHIINFHHSF